MRIQSTILGIMIFVAVVRGEAYLYQDEFFKMGSDYIRLLDSLPSDDWSTLASDQKVKCEQRYRPILQDDVIDIRIPMGYFDWTIGKEVLKNGTNYGYSPSIDLGAYAAIRSLLLRRCSGASQFCGFDQSDSYLFTKRVSVRGRNYQVRIQIYFSSETELLLKNIGGEETDQIRRSAFMESFFKNSLRGADAVFYFGHSRNGGGPDFKPPILLPDQNKVNYNGYYKVKRPGYNLMMSALSSGAKISILGLMSCDSRDHFLKGLRSAAPQAGVITSTAVITVDEVFTALIGGVDAILRGQCQKGFYKSLRMTERNQTYITMDGMFE